LTRRPSLRKLRASFENFPSELFTEYFGKLKTIFGHMKRDPDPEDPLSKKTLKIDVKVSLDGSPVYNLVYDKSGKYVVTAADDG